MNERVMQFRIGMFVIVAGLVLTMMIVWFGESPSLFRDRAYVTVHYVEAPGVAEGIPVRKSGIRVGEVAAIKFDDRPNHADGVLVTIALERKYRIRDGSTPRITRALIGDVSIDLLPSPKTTPMAMGADPEHAPIIEGEVAPDPSKALEAATAAFVNVQGTLESIDNAARGVATLAKKAEQVDAFLANWSGVGQKLSGMVDDARPALASIRQVSDKLNGTLDPKAQADLKASFERIGLVMTKLDGILTDFKPLARDLGADSRATPTTKFGVLLSHLGRVSYDLSLLTTRMEDGHGGLNRDGTLQRLVLESTLHEDLRQAAISARVVFVEAKVVMQNFNAFAKRIAQSPSDLIRRDR